MCFRLPRHFAHYGGRFVPVPNHDPRAIGRAVLMDGEQRVIGAHAERTRAWKFRPDLAHHCSGAGIDLEKAKVIGRIIIGLSD
jgi:hypothetical protein